MKPDYVYVASSWRNNLQPAVVKALEVAGIPCYDFKNPAPGDNGFHWSEIDPTYKRGCPCGHQYAHSFCTRHGEPLRSDGSCACPKPEPTMTAESYLEVIEHPIAWAGFNKDFEAMHKADTFVLVLPCGKSAHLELGWAVGHGKRTAILLEDPMQPELMYKMVDYIAPSLFDLLGWLGVKD